MLRNTDSEGSDHKTYLFTHVVDDFKVLRVRKKCVCVYCDVVVKEWHHVCNRNGEKNPT